jgi:hypothetical protein
VAVSRCTVHTFVFLVHGDLHGGHQGWHGGPSFAADELPPSRKRYLATARISVPRRAWNNILWNIGGPNSILHDYPCLLFSSNDLHVVR